MAEYTLRADELGAPFDLLDYESSIHRLKDDIRLLSFQIDALLMVSSEAMMLSRVNLAHVDKTKVPMARQAAGEHYREIKNGLNPDQ